MISLQVVTVDWIWCTWSVSQSLSVTVVYIVILRETQVLKIFGQLYFWSFTKDGLVEVS